MDSQVSPCVTPPRHPVPLVCGLAPPMRPPPFPPVSSPMLHVRRLSALICMGHHNYRGIQRQVEVREFKCILRYTLFDIPRPSSLPAPPWGHFCIFYFPPPLPAFWPTLLKKIECECVGSNPPRTLTVNLTPTLTVNLTLTLTRTPMVQQQQTNPNS